MGKVIGTIGVVVAAVALTATGIGAIAAPALAGAVTIGGVSASTLLLAGTALQAVGRVLTKQPKPSGSTTERLNASLVTDTPRKMVFGRTAMNTDLRYQEWWGSDQEYCSQVFALASHHCTSLDEIWLDDKLAWTSTRGVIGEFVGYLVVQSYMQASAGSVFNANWSRRWGAQATFSGCATLYLQFKVTGNGKKGKSPFTSSITSRLSVVGKGAPLPDPRFDSTAGGSGALRVADQTTWSWAPQGYEVGRNPALALLFYLIGWRIRNPTTGEWKLAVGRGVPIDRINLDSFITAANLCDEPVLRTNGVSEPRYRCDGTFSEGDDPSQVIANFETCMNAKLRDSAGRFSLQVLHNDLATPVLDFTDDDVLGDFSWTAGNDLNDRRNVVRGRYTDPSALYQLADFPQIKLPALDGIDRIESLDLALVQSPGQAQRLAKQRVQRQQYEGEFRASFNARGWAVKDGDIVRLTFSALGFDKKLFRVSEGLIDPTGSVPLVLGEEHPSIYAWDREESPAVQAAVPNTFNPLLLPIIAAIDDAGQTADWPAITGEGKPEDYADVTKDHLPDAWAEFTGIPATQVVSDLRSAVDTIAAETMRSATWRGESDDVIYMPDGRPVRVAVEAIGANVDGVQQFVAFLKEVDTSAKTSKFLFSARSDGSIVGIEGVAGGGFNQLSFVASRFLFVDENGGNPINAMTYENGVWRMKSIEVEKFKAGSVDSATLALFSIRRSYDVELAGNMALPYSAGSISVASITFTKDLADSALEIEWMMRMRPGGTYAGYFQLEISALGAVDQVWFWAGTSEINNIRSVRGVEPYRRSFQNISAGSVTATLRFVYYGHNDGTGSGFIEAGSIFSAEEKKR